MVYKSLIKDVPMFNQQVSSSKDTSTPIGRIDEILGPLKHFYFTVAPSQGIEPSSVKAGSKIYLDKAFILPLIIFTNPIKPSGPKRMGGGVGGRPAFGGRPGGNFGGRPQGNSGGRPQGNFGGRPQGNFGGRPQGNFGAR